MFGGGALGEEGDKDRGLTGGFAPALITFQCPLQPLFDFLPKVFRDIVVEVTGINGSKHHLKTTILDDFLTAEEGKLPPYDQRALYIEFKERMRKRDIKSGTEVFREALATIPGLDEFAVRCSLFANAAGCLGLLASNRVQP